MNVDDYGRRNKIQTTEVIEFNLVTWIKSDNKILSKGKK